MSITIKFYTEASDQTPGEQGILRQTKETPLTLDNLKQEMLHCYVKVGYN